MDKLCDIRINGGITMVYSVKSMGFYGMDAYEITIEADVAMGMPAFDLSGLPDASVKEARERVRSAIVNNGFVFPLRRIVINLAPANVKKAGSYYDLPILVALLQSTGTIGDDLTSCAFIGELSLSGEVRPVNGILPMTIRAREIGIKTFFVPADNAFEASVVDGITVIPLKNVRELVEHLNHIRPIPAAKHFHITVEDQQYDIDFADVKGQYTVKRALEIAAAGGHNILLIGSPGSGKSMMAKRMPTILPDMTFEEMIETTKIHSVAGVMPANVPLITRRPFRAPHHTISSAGLSGGGSIPRPGEISLAHNGVLFLDELPEFNRQTLEILRQPMEDGVVTISRVSATLTYPCSVMVVAAMNPCPCGYYGHPTRACTCSSNAISRYLSRISGPLLDRMDMHIEVPPVAFTQLAQNDEGCDTSGQIRQRVNRVRSVQNERFAGTHIHCNAAMTPAMVSKYCVFDDRAREYLTRIYDAMGFSARAYSKVLKVARTIADLDGSELIQKKHVLEATRFRNLDMKYWKNSPKVQN